MPSDSPVSVLDTFFDALNAHAPDRAARQLASAYRGIDATRSAVTVGRENARAEIETGLAAFSPTFTVQQCLADSPRVALFWQMEAVHEGPFLQIPPTNKSVSVTGTGLFTVHNGHITRGIHLWDLAGLLRSVDLLPDLPENGEVPDETASPDSILEGE